MIKKVKGFARVNPFSYLCVNKQIKNMKLTFYDYLIGFLISLPVFGGVVFGLTVSSDLSDKAIYSISLILTTLDYSYYLVSVRKDKIIEQLQDRVKEIEQELKNKK